MPRVIPAAALAGLLAFTNPMGVTIHIDSESIVAVTPGAGHCQPADMTRLDLGHGSYCVRETVEEVVRRVNGAADEAEDK